MAKIIIPQELAEVLNGSNMHAAIFSLVDRTSEIFTDNLLPFFPDYTDHGIDHINGILTTEIELIPKAVWERNNGLLKHKIITPADAAVIIASTILHDIAMHIREDGFLELVAPGSRFRPVKWFREDQEGHDADRPWSEIWNDFEREAKRFGQRELVSIIGEEQAANWSYHGLPKSIYEWQRNHRLIIGEFIRRHHARLAHEIALYGFPGLEIGSADRQFPALGSEIGHPLTKLADLIGLVARSHGISMRVCKAYLNSSGFYTSTPRPMDTAVLYPMALLRVADYFQLEQQRAPAVLLQLRNPQSPISVQEWNKHRAVESVTAADDPRGKVVTVSDAISLSLYLQLRELLEGLQAEMDHATAVLDETYGTRGDLGLDLLNLSIRRVYSNLFSPVFKRSLPYLPEYTGFAADPNILTLLVEPLYGRYPGVGVRELIQNSSDAVYEAIRWCETHSKSFENIGFAKQDEHVLVEFIQQNTDKWILRIQDKGIGMSSTTLQDFFLRAGATFRNSKDWAREFLDDTGKSTVQRTGRFGIGAFAIFLLGKTFRLWTKHINADNSDCVYLEANINSHLIELTRVENIPVGTLIEVDLSPEAVDRLELDFDSTLTDGPNQYTDWFCWDFPKILRVVRRLRGTEILEQRFELPVAKGKLSVEWSKLEVADFQGVYWTFGNWPQVSCNGIRICGPDLPQSDDAYSISRRLKLHSPSLAIVDNMAKLPLTTQRFNISFDLPFEAALIKDIYLSYIAYLFVCCPNSREELLEFPYHHPLHRVMYYNPTFDRYNEPYIANELSWCATLKGFTVLDPTLYEFLQVDSYILIGGFRYGPGYDLNDIKSLRNSVYKPLKNFKGALISFVSRDSEYYFTKEPIAPNSVPTTHDTEQEEINIHDLLMRILVVKGIFPLNHEVTSSSLAVTTDEDLIIHEKLRKTVVTTELDSIDKKWKKISLKEYDNIYSLQHGERKRDSTIANVIEMLAHSRADRARMRYRDHECVYAVQTTTRVKANGPKSMLATVWHELIGSNAIPFEEKSRTQLMKLTEKNVQFQSHIRMWVDLKKSGSKWSTFNPYVDH